MKRLATAAVVVGALVAGVGSAFAAPGGPLVETFPATFELSSATCSNLPAGTTIEGSGIGTSITSVRTDQTGVTTIMNTTHSHGTATDQAGNTYVFDYSNSFRVSNTVDDPDSFSGLMSDHFSLSGSGPARLNNGFVALITTNADFSSFSFESISSHGDPISFPDGTAHCDPL